MTILGIDYGDKNLGLAFASSPLAEPLENLKLNKKTIDKIGQITSRLKIELIVIGISEGTMAEKTKSFASELSRKLNLPLKFQDETLSSKLAVQKLQEGQATKKKRHGPLHSYSAAIILQEFLDRQNPSPEVRI